MRRKFVVAALLSALCAASTTLAYWIHIRFIRVDVVLYSAVMNGSRA